MSANPRSLPQSNPSYEFDAPQHVDFLHMTQDNVDDSWFSRVKPTNSPNEIPNAAPLEKRQTKVFIPSTPSTPYVSAVKPHKRRRLDDDNVDRNLFGESQKDNKENAFELKNSTQPAQKSTFSSADPINAPSIIPSNILTSFGTTLRMDKPAARVPRSRSKQTARKHIPAPQEETTQEYEQPETDLTKKRKRTQVEITTAAPALTAPKLTIPQSPAFQTAKRFRAQVLKTLTPEKQGKPKRTDLVHCNAAVRPSVTIPKPFRLRTEERIQHAPVSSQQETLARSPYREKRDRTPSRFRPVPSPVSPVQFNRELTIPKTPNFATASREKFVRHKEELTATPFEEAENQKKAFFLTPPRFKAKPDAPLYTSPPRGVTIPETPAVLKHAPRSRHIPTSEELELAEMEKAQFKARPVDKGILKGNGTVGIKTLRSVSPTKPQPFSFSATSEFQKKREERLRAKIQQELAAQTAAAAAESITRKRKRTITATTQDQPAPKRRKLTVTTPQSPNITKPKTKVRTYVEEDPNHHKFVARPMPKYRHSAPIQTAPVKKTPTEIVPFNLATEKRGEWRAALQQPNEDQMKKAEKPFDPTPTVPQPFSLESETLHEYSLTRFQERLREEQAREEAMRQFKARPLPEFKPFRVHLNTEPLTQPLDIVTYSESRAESRRKFDEKRKQKQLEAEKQAERASKEKALRQQEEVMQLRRQIDKMNKARPLPSFYGKGKVQSRNTYFNNDCVLVEKENSVEIRKTSIQVKPKKVDTTEEHAVVVLEDKMEIVQEESPVVNEKPTLEEPVVVEQKEVIPERSVPLAPPVENAPAPSPKKSAPVLKDTIQKENAAPATPQKPVEIVDISFPTKSPKSKTQASPKPVPLQDITMKQNTRRLSVEAASNLLSKANKQVVIYNDEGENDDTEVTIREEIIQVPIQRTTVTLSKLDRLRLAARMQRMMR